MTNLNNIVEMLAKQALGSQASNATQSSDKLGGLLGAVVSQLGQGQSNSSAGGGLGGMLGSVLGQLGQSQAPAQNPASSSSSLLIMVVPLILNWVQQQGGLSGVISSLQKAGLGSQAQQWLDPNQNNAEAPVAQVQQLFQASDVQSVADQAQVPAQQVYAAISSVLPQIVDALTPHGEQTDHAEANRDISNVMGMLGQLIK